MAKKISESKLNLYLREDQVELLQKMVDSGLYGSITVPNATGGEYTLSHVAMNRALSHVAMNSALSHVAMNRPLSHIAMNAALSHIAMNAALAHTPESDVKSEKPK